MMTNLNIAATSIRFGSANNAPNFFSLRRYHDKALNCLGQLRKMRDASLLTESVSYELLAGLVA